MTHLHLVQSPLQVLNAFEARQSLGSNPEIDHRLVLFEKNNSYHNQLVTNTLAELGWRPWLVLPPPRRRWHKITQWLSLRRAVSGLGCVERVWVGEYSSGMMVAAANICRGAEVGLVDDGTSSLGFPDFRYRGVRDGRYPPRRPMPWLRFNPELPASVTFFSFYDIGLVPPDRREPNELRFLRRGLKIDPEGPVFFVGSSLPDNEEMSYGRFFQLMRGARRHLQGRHVVYFPHRAEDMDKKRDVFDELAIEIRFNDLPFELALLKHEPFSAVAGFYTTPLDTLRLSGAVPGERLISFHVPRGDISTPAEAEMSEVCYRNYESTPGMVVVRDYAAAP